MGIVFLVLGIVCILYGILVLSIIGLSSWFNFIFVIMGVVFLVLALIWKKLKKPIKTALIVLMCIAFLFFSFFEYKIISFSLKNIDDDCDYVMVLGARVRGDTPSRDFSERIKLSAKYLNDHPDSFVITTGGKGYGENLSEGEAAKKMLIGLGIDEDRIIVEDKSTRTKENIDYSIKLLFDQGIDLKGKRICIVSSSFHLYRAGIIGEKLGLSNLGFLGAKSYPYLIPQYYLREFAAVVYEILF